jgi:hypothetical protein
MTAPHSNCNIYFERTLRPVAQPGGALAGRFAGITWRAGEFMMPNGLPIARLLASLIFK